MQIIRWQKPEVPQGPDLRRLMENQGLAPTCGQIVQVSAIPFIAMVIKKCFIVCEALFVLSCQM